MRKSIFDILIQNKTNFGRKLSTMVAAVMLASVAAMSLVCCSEKTHKYKIGISQCSDDKWRQKQNSEFRFMSYINDSVEVDIKSAKDNNVQQAAQIDSLVDEGIDLLVVCPNQLDGVTKAIERAYDKGIPVIFFDRTTNSNKYTAFIGCDNYRIGFDLGTYIANQLNGSGRVVEIRGLDNSSPAKGRHEGFVDALKNYPDVKIVASEGADWEQTGAEKAMEKILAKTTDFDYVYAHNDRMAYAAYLTMRRHNLSGKAKFVGVDGLLGKGGGVEMVNEGILDASYLNPTGGLEVVDLAMKILTGKDFNRSNSLSTTIITKNNAELTLMTDLNAEQQRNMLERLHNQVNKYQRYNSGQELFISLLGVLLVLLIAAVVMMRKSSMAKGKLAQQLTKRNEELNKLNTEVIALTQSRLRFFTNVSHELRTPLTLIVDPVEQLFKDEKLSKHGRNLLVIVRRNANALRRLVDDIMDFRKIQDGNVKLHLCNFSLAEKVRQWVSDFYPTVEKKNVNLEINTDKYTDSDFVGDEEKINRIVFNLVSNAVKFTPAGGTVMVTLCDMPDRKVLISVSDTGKGIPEEDREKVFERFFQTEGTEGGTGIGLAIVKAYAELHGGQVMVSSHEGQGSNFIVVIPREHSGEQVEDMAVESCCYTVDDENAGAGNNYTAMPADEDAGVKHSLVQKVIGGDNKPTLLIADDNKEIRDYMKALLSDDYVIIEAADGNEALKMARTFHPDLVISDVMMPGIDGLELCAELKRNSSTSQIPVIIVSAKALDEQKIEGYENGADSYITKPFSSKLLRTRIENLLSSRRKLKDSITGMQDVAEDPVGMSSSDQEFVERLRLIIQHNMGYSEFGVEAIGREMGLSRVQLYRKVKAVMGISVVDLLRKSRLQRAKSQLEHTDKGIAEIAYEVGFSSPSYFTKCFKDEYGMQPSDIRSGR